MAALRSLTEALAAQGDHAGAMRVGRELVRHDPLDEAGHRLVFDVHGAAGDRAGAMRLYHELAATLRRELGSTRRGRRGAPSPAVLDDRGTPDRGDSEPLTTIPPRRP